LRSGISIEHDRFAKPVTIAVIVRDFPGSCSDLLNVMRRLVKFLHTMGAIGFMGAMACLLVLLGVVPAPTSLPEYARVRAAMGDIATWIFLPSLALTLIAGLLALAVNRAYQSAGWAWAKLATGILVFEWGFSAIQGPMQQEAELSARALAGEVDAATLAGSLGAESGSLWVMLAVATANVVLGIWRPRFLRLSD
jgi:hypothetical protein